MLLVAYRASVGLHQASADLDFLLLAQEHPPCHLVLTGCVCWCTAETTWTRTIQYTCPEIGGIEYSMVQQDGKAAEAVEQPFHFINVPVVPGDTFVGALKGSGLGKYACSWQPLAVFQLSSTNGLTCVC